MAKRRKEKDEEEDKPFKLPKFNKEKFLKREKRNIKTTFVSFLFGALIAIISFGFYVLLTGNNVRWYLIFVFGIFTGSWLKYIFIKLKIDLTDFGKKNWFGSYMIYFFTWLVVLIIMVNPPIYDDEKPKISLTVLPDMQEFGGDVLIVAKITDNFGVKKKDITFILEDEKVSQNDFEFIENQVFKYVHKSPSNSTVDKKYKFTLIVKDKSGLTSQKSGTFEYSNDTITLSSKEHISVNNGDTINFNVRAKNIDRVYYTINNNKTKIDMYYNQNSGFYETYPKYWAGIKENENVTLNVYAVCYQYFKQATNEQNSDKWKLEDLKWYNSFNNTIVDSSEYNFTADDDMIGDTPPTFTQISPKEVFDKVPGFEILAFILSLAVLVLIFKYRKKHRRN